MIKLQIEDFPEAVFDPQTMTGYLCSYYLHKTMDDDQWRSTYSPQILDFKEGSDSAIGYFVKPFIELIKQALLIIGRARAVLIPVPSSIAKSDPNFSSVPYNKAKMPKRKNRDNRCQLFVEKIVLSYAAANSISSSELVVRTKTKAEKRNRSAKEQLDTLALVSDEVEKIDTQNDIVFILIDDVQTSGGTLKAVEELLRKEFLNSTILSLSIAKSMEVSQYKPLYRG
ncbi:MAG: hypothetical protein RL189_742 [Pseudomonadota bacterium]|jgi:predicted amidophosphoribosyltransferase